MQVALFVCANYDILIKIQNYNSKLKIFGFYSLIFLFVLSFFCVHNYLYHFHLPFLHNGQKFF